MKKEKTRINPVGLELELLMEICSFLLIKNYRYK